MGRKNTIETVSFHLYRVLALVKRRERKTLQRKKHAPLSFGHNHIGFCYYDENKCPFPGYCKSCEEVEAWFKPQEMVDDGNEISPDSALVPGLCVHCIKYRADDWEENLLCLVNRSDQRIVHLLYQFKRKLKFLFDFWRQFLIKV